ncbi:hypothetical protein MHB71_00045 [Paenibacillus sp. FSL H7-0940]|uniref:hypothetical protein n=1 Tax=Paenibacillus sp. FSL H7-0940 TaxID=2921443 RepID=UPI0030EB53E4
MAKFVVDGQEVRLETVPDRCPHCGVKKKPFFEYGTTVKVKNMIAVFSCKNNECYQLFLGYYSKITDFITFNLYRLDSVAPKEFRAPKLDQYIVELSQNFAEIYKQAAHAEEMGLDQICGPGYRKAFEFLIKDYLIKKYPDREEQYNDMSLSQCINDLPDGDFKFVSQRAAWLGNDVTHYVRKWDEKDIDDLKTLIEHVMDFIKREPYMDIVKAEMAERR